MDDANSRAGFEPGGEDDRRSQHNLRLIFDRACEVSAPFFDSSQSWGGSSLTMFARQTLRETFPELTQQEIAILFSAVTRHFRTPPNVGKAPST
jgi:hypothetical protein